jgi:hypothetical protein
MRAGLSATVSPHALMSGSDPNDIVARAPRTFMVAHVANVLPYGVGGHSRFFSASSSRVASTYPASAAPKQGNPDRIGCNVIADAPQMGTNRGVREARRRTVHDEGVLRDRH